MRALLGVDAGQTVTKAVVFSEDWRELGAGSARVPVASPHPRWVERDMDLVWSATATAIRSALADATSSGGISGPDEVGGVGIVGHNDGLYLIGKDGRPVRPAITAMDTRALEILDTWRMTDIWPSALALTGQVPFGGSPPGLLAWMLRNEPSALDDTKWVLYCKDWLRFRLTGEIATDPSEASAAFMSAVTQEYSAEALSLYGLSELAGMLPPILSSHAIAGEVNAFGASETGLSPGTPVVTGAHDVDGTALGTGVVAPGTLGLVAGTFSINQVVSDSLSVDERWRARTFIRQGHWLNMSTSPTSATNLDWWRELFGGLASYEKIEAEVAASKPDSGIIYHPFLYGSPFGGDATAAMVGLRGWHSRGDIARAIYEGVVFGHRMHVDALRDTFDVDSMPARLSGGAARSPIWSQMFADALNVEIEIPDCEETGARGAALLAALGIGRYSSFEEAASTTTITRRHSPEREGRERHFVSYEKFIRTADALQQAGG